MATITDNYIFNIKSRRRNFRWYNSRMAYQEVVKIPTIEESLSRLLQLPEDIKLIREKEKLGLTQFARTFGVNKSTAWRWQTGKRTPEEPLVLFGITSWADRLRNVES